MLNASLLHKTMQKNLLKLGLDPECSKTAIALCLAIQVSAL